MEFRTEFADYKDELAFLRAYLTEQGYLYYVLDAPVIPDYEYDRLNRRLEELEAEHPEEITPDSPTQRVGGKILDAFQPYAHEVPLESLQDVFNEGEVAAFCEKMEEALGPMAEYSVEPKVDGLSVALEYRDGVFVRGATRGDGQVGEDVTENLRKEGLARELVNRIQNLRKSSGYDITDKISVTVLSNDGMDEAIKDFNSYIANQVLAVSVEITDVISDATEMDFEDFKLSVRIEKA